MSIDYNVVDHIVGDSYDWSPRCRAVVLEVLQKLIDSGMEEPKAIELVTSTFWAAANEFGA